MNPFRTLVLLIISNATFAIAQTILVQAQAPPQKAIETHLFGKTSLGALKQAPFAEWFEKGYNDYSPTPSVVERLTTMPLQKELSVTKIQIFLGTWCGDSKREVPRMIKVLHKVGVPDTNIEFICLSSADSLYKQSPAHEERGREIYRVPTMIFTQTGKEIGRIVEFPAESLERDVVAILSKSGYSPNYRSYPLVQSWLQSGLLSDTNTSVYGMAAKLRFTISSESELNSVGYVLLARKQTQEAIFIFSVNTRLFPQSSNCFDSLAEAYEKAGNMLLAIKHYERAMELDSKNAHALARLVKLKSLL